MPINVYRRLFKVGAVYVVTKRIGNSSNSVQFFGRA
jgi:hypothetical protein